MHDDDRTVGRVLSRREVVGLLGLSGAALLVDPLTGQAVQRESGVAPCVVQPRQTEGPVLRRRHAEPAGHPHRTADRERRNQGCR